jgi:hypothetical protein
MKPVAVRRVGAVALIAICALARPAEATTVPVFFNFLVDTATVGSLLHAEDTLFVDTLVTTEVGGLQQSVTFTVGSGVEGFSGEAAWEINTGAGSGPRLVGVNIDLFDATDSLVATDAFAGTLSGFALSGLTGVLGPGTYELVITGTAVRAASLDVSLTFIGVPEPDSASCALLSCAALLALRSRRSTPRRSAR